MWSYILHWVHSVIALVDSQHTEWPSDIASTSLQLFSYIKKHQSSWDNHILKITQKHLDRCTGTPSNSSTTLSVVIPYKNLSHFQWSDIQGHFVQKNVCIMSPILKVRKASQNWKWSILISVLHASKCLLIY